MAYDPFIGEIMIFAGNFAPRGWAFCDGTLIPISTNTALFALIAVTLAVVTLNDASFLGGVRPFDSGDDGLVYDGLARGMLRKLMTQQGYQTFVATSGERALSIARRVHPDLILLDVVISGMDGLETCRQLKQHPGTQRIPVILMSAVATINTHLRQQSAEMLPKPFDLDLLLSTIDQYLAA